eukprot:CAMPEP_0204297026 /NCGR_PEP_ID=MMETSP0468-20130131/72489_1 /ASSEMBLY_ACC=CAM_ASM_000383 /TAXON_ID=2969 /ORGANISM="Oxyrrhis marina" /LENGTH=53 /DNA_ID=CAMNT_0051275791 /DNA_START=10 /DNA_END=167 /DNA_ORIENTATION=+
METRRQQKPEALLSQDPRQLADALKPIANASFTKSDIVGSSPVADPGEPPQAA